MNSIRTESQIWPLGPWPAARVNPGNGLLIEVVRAVVIIVGALLVVVGRFLGKEAAELLPHFSLGGTRAEAAGAAFPLPHYAGLLWPRGCSPVRPTTTCTTARERSGCAGAIRSSKSYLDAVDPAELRNDKIGPTTTRKR